MKLDTTKTIDFAIGNPSKNPAKDTVPMDKEEFCVHVVTSRDTIDTRRTTTGSNTTKYVYVKMKNGQLTEFANYKWDFGYFDRWLKEHRNYRACGLADRSLQLVENNANFTELSVFLKELKLTKQEIGEFKYTLSKNANNIDKIKKVEGIKDKFLTKMIAEYASHKEATISCDYLRTWAMKKVSDIKDFIANDAVLSTRLEKQYPLIEELCCDTKGIESDISIYLNSKYNLTK